jgi:probable H4MPT-linked C1 transfer pathway protein
MSWLGLDIGGANLKAADGCGWAKSVAFPLWRNPQGLAGTLTTLIENGPMSERLAVTMTGELCDCFSSKADGVLQILSAVEPAAGGREVGVYLVDGRFVSIVEARDMPQLAAASNWHALARFACRFVTGPTGLLVDVGSTTTDIIPLVDGKVAARGRNDTERLLHRELLYRGVGRTPICAVMHSLPWHGNPCSIAAEVFSTTADAYVIRGDLREDSNANWTADGRPLTKQHSRQRLARQLCADAVEFGPGDVEEIARAIFDAQCDELTHSIRYVAEQLPEAPTTCVLGGAGEFLVEAVGGHLWPGCRQISLSAEIGLSASTCAPAHAVAVLASEAVH